MILQSWLLKTPPGEVSTNASVNFYILFQRERHKDIPPVTVTLL